MVYKYRLKFISRNCSTPEQRMKRSIKRLKRYSKFLKYQQSRVIWNKTFLKGLTGFIHHTYTHKHKESLLLRIITWFRLWKFFTFNKSNYKFN